MEGIDFYLYLNFIYSFSIFFKSPINNFHLNSRTHPIEKHIHVIPQKKYSIYSIISFILARKKILSEETNEITTLFLFSFLKCSHVFPAFFTGFLYWNFLYSINNFFNFYSYSGIQKNIKS